MKINPKSIVGNKPKSTDTAPIANTDTEYDKHVDFYYTNIVSAIILYTYDTVTLGEMAAVLIDPLAELYEELEYAFTPVCFETVFRLEVIDRSLKKELLDFKREVDDIPKEMWNWQLIDNHTTWIATRGRANELLNKLGVTSRNYNDRQTTIYVVDAPKNEKLR